MGFLVEPWCMDVSEGVSKSYDEQLDEGRDDALVLEVTSGEHLSSHELVVHSKLQHDQEVDYVERLEVFEDLGYQNHHLSHLSKSSKERYKLGEGSE